MAYATTDPGQRSASEIEQEVDAERARVSETIDALQRKVSVGNIVDQVVKAVGENGGEISRNMAASLRQNPLAVVLTGVGLVWLMAGSGPGGGYVESDEDRWRDDRRRPERWRAGSQLDPVEEGYDDYAEYRNPENEEDVSGEEGVEGGLRERVSGAAAAVSDGASAAAGRIREGAASAGAGMSRLAGRVGEAGHRVTRHAPGLGDMRHRAARAGRSGLHGIEDFMQEQPLVAGALALALGAALGSALPRTRTEDDLFGEESDRVKRSLRTTAEEEGSKLARSASAVADEAKSVVGEAVDGLASSGSSALDRVEEALDDATERLRRRAGEEAGTQEGSATEETEQQPAHSDMTPR
jgi:hypothetical protein